MGLAQSLLILIFVTVSVLVGCQQPPSGSGSAGAATPETAGIFGGRKVQERDAVSKFTVGVISYKANGELQLCSGSLIDWDLVITAAHCVTGDLSKIRVFFTTSMRYYEEIPASRVRGVKAGRAHEMYRQSADQDRYSRYDVGLLRLSAKAPSFARPILMFENKVPFEGLPELHVAGFGARGYDRSSGRAQGQDFSLNTAIIERKGEGPDSNLMLDQSKGKGVCVGDSGGPAFLMHDSGDFVLVGVVSDVYNDDRARTCSGQGSLVSIYSVFDWVMKTAVQL